MVLSNNEVDFDISQKSESNPPVAEIHEPIPVEEIHEPIPVAEIHEPIPVAEIHEPI